MEKDISQKRFWQSDKSGRRSPDHPVVRYAYISTALKAKDLLKGEEIKNVLDCGCGNGFFQSCLAEVFKTKCAGVDYSPQMLELNPNPEKHLASADKLPFGDETFDLVTCSQLLHHLNDKERKKAVSEMARVSRKFIFIAEPNRYNPLNAAFFLMKKEEREGLKFTKKYLRSLCADSGLTVLNCYIDSMVAPNKTPQWALPLFKFLDKTFFASIAGLNTNCLCKKR